ncbi:unnamed protein product [Pleuronectes platessa]|uniref:Uncharacterized protein n=1 Tax=Pleuronectes platessa TaxID=8262 RepID=A0A9N7Y7L5_PLEPL|nr:unnamed protein product [Pleuronectes platessa]
MSSLLVFATDGLPSEENCVSLSGAALWPEMKAAYSAAHFQERISVCGYAGQTEHFAEIFGNDSAAESRKSQESFKKWLFAGMTLVTGVVVGSLIAQKRIGLRILTCCWTF